MVTSGLKIKRARPHSGARLAIARPRCQKPAAFRTIPATIEGPRRP
jgi:hypothetical protein